MLLHPAPHIVNKQQETSRQARVNLAFAMALVVASASGPNSRGGLPKWWCSQTPGLGLEPCTGGPLCPPHRGGAQGQPKLGKIGQKWPRTVSNPIKETSAWVHHALWPSGRVFHLFEGSLVPHYVPSIMAIERIHLKYILCYLRLVVPREIT